MTEETKGSKLDPSPLDAYVTAEPNEPVFTLQGGDVLAGPLVIMWARLARARCGLGFEPIATFDWLHDIVKNHQVEKQGEISDLLFRATEAEQVAWAMGNYRKGHAFEETEAAVPKVEARLDLHDYLIHAASRISNAFSELADMIEPLEKLGITNAEIIPALKNEILALRLLYNVVEPRPLMRIENVYKW